MQVEELIRAAQERTGLEEFDSDSFREPLELMVAGINARSERDHIAAALGPEMIDALANRLREKAASLISHRMPFDRVIEALDVAADPQSAKVMIDFEAQSS